MLDYLDSAQEHAFGRWLYDLPTVDRPDDHPKGLLIQIPVDDCGALLDRPADEAEEILVVVNDTEPSDFFRRMLAVIVLSAC